VASTANTLETNSTTIGPGVPSLRAGQGISFVLRRLHSLSGVVPIGAFLLEHFISNSEATKGALAYNEQVKFLTGLPFVTVLEWVFIFLPILYHALYGFYIWYRGESNVGEYPWAGNWLYTSQRWTGMIAFFYIVYHTYYMRFTGVHLLNGGYNNAFWKVWNEFQNPWAVAAYVIGIIAASWHFSYGLWLFAAKWGITVGDRARKYFGYLCTGLAVILIAIGLWTIKAFLATPADQVPRPTASQPFESTSLQ
jgi:succinate dehydrogenase / fumarate reductase cytochrome b subunit